VCGPDGHCFYAGLAVRAPSGLPLGALCVLNEKPREFSDTERAALQDLRGALEEALMLRSLAVVDALTGLFNRRHFEQVVSREWLRGFAAQPPVALFMFDVDHFKRYNDHYGHAQGDQCLRSVAAVLHAGARRVGDVLARIGGEEFAIVAPNTDAEAAASVAQRIRSGMQEFALPHAAAPLGRVSVSIGCAITHDTRAVTLTQLMKQADEALYEAKAAGRDRMVLAAV
jgi:diguanylate cyclase (GGDEF)-like protein